MSGAAGGGGALWVGGGFGAVRAGVDVLGAGDGPGPLDEPGPVDEPGAADVPCEVAGEALCEPVAAEADVEDEARTEDAEPGGLPAWLAEPASVLTRPVPPPELRTATAVMTAAAAMAAAAMAAPADTRVARRRDQCG